jgi:hypothetical protein
MRLLAEADLVDLQHSGIHDPVRQGLQPQHREPLRPVWNDAAAARDMIEILDDHARIEQHRPILQQKGRNFAQRILPAQAVMRVVRISGLDREAVRKAEHIGCDLDLAAEWRGGDDRRIMG